MNHYISTSGLLMNGPKDGPQALAEAARNAPTTMEEAQARIAAAKAAHERGPVAREGETRDMTLRRVALEQRDAREAAERDYIEKQTALSVSQTEMNMLHKRQVNRHIAVPELGRMVVTIGGGLEISYAQGREMVREGNLSEDAFVDAVLKNGRRYDPSFNMPRSTILGK